MTDFHVWCLHLLSFSLSLSLSLWMCVSVCVSHQQFLCVNREIVLRGKLGVEIGSEAQNDMFMTRHKLLFYLICKILFVLPVSASVESIFNIKCQTNPLWHSGKLILIVAESAAQSSPNGPREHMAAAAAKQREKGRERSHFPFSKHPVPTMAPKYNQPFWQSFCILGVQNSCL